MRDDERLAYLEGRLEDHFKSLDDLRATTRDLRADMNRQFADVRAEVGQLRADMDRGFADLRAEIDQLRADTDRRFGEVRVEIACLRGDMTRYFTWLVGLQVASLVAIVGALVGTRLQ